MAAYGALAQETMERAQQSGDRELAKSYDVSRATISWLGHETNIAYVPIADSCAALAERGWDLPIGTGGATPVVIFSRSRRRT